MNYESNLMQLFPTPIMIVDLSGHPCKEKTLEIIDTAQTYDHHLLSKGRSNFESTGGFLFHPDLQDLKNTLEDSINKFSKMMGTLPIKLSNNWFNIMEQSGTVQPHRHEGSVISGAYYIRAPQGSCDLHFTSPLAQLRMFELTAQSNPLNYGFTSIPCKEDTLILFPSWLEHYTDSNDNNQRTVVSFNTDYRK